jgi:hypothetical protein
MPRPTLASLLEDFRNWNKTQDWMLNKQRDIYGNEDPDTIALNEKLAGIGTADMGIMGSSVGGLAGMLIPAIGVNKIPKIENLAKAADKFIYHSGTADMAPDLRYGITPTNEGAWIREVAEGATDDVDNLLEQSTPLSWYSSTPEWIKIKVARKLGKALTDVNEQDILEHGHLAMVPKKGQHAKDVWYVGSGGLQDDVINLLGQKKTPSLTDLYGENNYGQRTEPFGVERNEYVTTQDIEPMFQLTGNDLLSFLKAIGSSGGK